MDRSDVTLERMRSFVRVAERGSLSAVAREFGVGQSTITRHLLELEGALGLPLLVRTTRRVSLTDEGTRYYGSASAILRMVDQAGDEVRAARNTSVGTVRLSCTAALGVRHICRLMFGFQDRYREIDVDIGLTDERVDLVREGVDIALRLGPLADSSMKLRRLGMSQRILVAAPRYLEARGRPLAAADLAQHEGVRMTNIAGSDRLSLRDQHGETHNVAFGGRFRVDHGLAAREAMIAGRGIAPAHRWLVDDLIAAGQIEVVLADHALPSVPLNMLIVPERSGIERVRLLIDYLTEHISTIPGIV